jgi:hypothetical protein
MPGMTVTDELVANNETYSAQLRQGRSAAAAGEEGGGGRLYGRSARPGGVLGLEESDAHVIRNAGGW